MAEIKNVEKVKLFIGVMYRDIDSYNAVVKILEEEFGEKSTVGDEFEFNFTEHYNNEMGNGLKKRFIVFGIIEQNKLSDVKMLTNEIEKEFSVDGKRKVNLDPGFIGKKQVVLASAKASPYRIYLRDGIYGQIVLVFSKHGCVELPHTFTDFKQKKVQEFLVKHAPVV